ncbi:CPBP family intramembrane metalloprotease [Candidatus Obscuribacterales bacterium]|nr:CPBP family intramembrane metalloprotease [Candidatus Obscuribacterales bacterium]MBX3137589.1 CPBP family intramembrane metalloprotease [Candidatus Obscuribacterales bacterium]
MPPKFSRGQLLALIIVMEALLLLVATIWCWIAKIDLLPVLSINNPAILLVGVGVGLVMAAFSFALSALGKRFRHKFPFFASFEEFIQETLAPIFSEVNPLDILLIALASGFCEEVFFRGVLQNQFGLVIASIVFGLFHVTGQKKHLFYVVWAALAGAMLGSLLMIFNSLWVPIIAHIINNWLSITMIRYEIGYRRY